MGPNEPEAPPRRVSFDPAAGRDMTHEDASKGLAWLYKHRPQVFADMMLFIHELDYTTSKRRANGQHR